MSTQDRIEGLRKTRERLRQGGGEARIARQKAAGKLTARERTELLFDPQTSQELFLYARHRCTCSTPTRRCAGVTVTRSAAVRTAPPARATTAREGHPLTCVTTAGSAPAQVTACTIRPRGAALHESLSTHAAIAPSPPAAIAIAGGWS